jgi:hypothetical protein
VLFEPFLPSSWFPVGSFHIWKSKSYLSENYISKLVTNSGVLPLSHLVLVHQHTPFGLVFPRTDQKNVFVFKKEIILVVYISENLLGFMRDHFYEMKNFRIIWWMHFIIYISHLCHKYLNVSCVSAYRCRLWWWRESTECMCSHKAHS